MDAGIRVDVRGVAIIPVGRKLAPRRYVFRMAEYESMGLHRLAVWAERNGMRLEKRAYWIAWA
ncbi:hypothetical protein [Paenibacillus sp. 1P07SE]|uniref:hypothetical protein n=1 Tax=Paenibacillus sp. 1P07SE TaxID=3132209 RepID=UPI0039A637B3